MIHGLALCAGIGGIELGLASVLQEYRTVCYVEIEAYAAAVLAARMEQGHLDPAPIFSELQTFDGCTWRGLVDIVSAGYPCQPFSVAGVRRGEDDPRHLWPHVARVIRECEPAQVFVENVPGHISMGLEAVATELQELGYRVSAGLFSAAEVGAPHIRQRLYILAANSECEPLRLQPGRSGGPHGEATPLPGLDGPAGLVADSDGQGELQPGGPVGAIGGWVGDGGGCWAVEPPVGRVANGIPNRVDRLRALGNAVVPHTAALAYRQLSEALCG